MKSDGIKTISFKDVKIDDISYDGVLKVLNRALNDHYPCYVCLTDVSNVMMASKNQALRVAINNSILSLADGTPLAWYGWMLGCKDIERISGADLMEHLFADMAGRKHYLLGDTQETIARVKETARKISPTIDIDGYSPPFKDFDEADNKQMLQMINESNPDIVWVSFGGGKQEKWMRENVSRLNHGVMIGVGAAFKFVVGDLITPPKAIQRMGLQWIIRLGQQLVKDPRNWLRVVKERELVKSKVDFVLALPREIKLGRSGR